MLILLHKSLFLENYPNHMKHMFTSRPVNYNLRGSNISSLSKPRTTTYGLHSFSYLSAKLWNSLLDDWRTCVQYHEFKKKIFSLDNFSV